MQCGAMAGEGLCGDTCKRDLSSAVVSQARETPFTSLHDLLGKATRSWVGGRGGWLEAVGGTIGM